MMINLVFLGVVSIISFLIIRFGSILQMLQFTLILTLFPATSVIPSFGDSPSLNLTAPYLGVAFLMVKAGLTISFSKSTLYQSLTTYPHLSSGFKNTIWLFVFLVIGIMISVTVPFILRNRIEVIGLRPVALAKMSLIGERLQTFHIFRLLPLKFSSQNIDQMLYLVATYLFTLLVATIAHGDKEKKALLASISIVSIAVALFSLIDFIGGLVRIPDLFGTIRTADYSLVIQSTEYGKRLNATFAEPSALATYCFPLLVFALDQWRQDIRTKLNGIIAASLFIVMVLCTSSTAYFCLALIPIYLVCIVFIDREVSISSVKFGILVLSVFVIVAFAICMSLILPSFASAFSKFFIKMTVDKSISQSASIREAWNVATFEAFKSSWGFGVGAGSVRASSFLLSVLGSTGIAGALALTLFVAKLFSTIFINSRGQGSVETRVSKSAAVAGISALIPLSVSGTVPDPGLIFALFAGLAVSAYPQALNKSNEVKKPNDQLRRHILAVDSV